MFGSAAVLAVPPGWMLMFEGTASGRGGKLAMSHSLFVARIECPFSITF